MAAAAAATGAGGKGPGEDFILLDAVPLPPAEPLAILPPSLAAAGEMAAAAADAALDPFLPFPPRVPLVLLGGGGGGGTVEPFGSPLEPLLLLLFVDGSGLVG